MKRKLTALISALTVATALVPSYATVSAAPGSSDLGEVLTQYKDWATASGDYKLDDNGYITKTAAVKVLSDMKATRNNGQTLVWKDKVVNNSYDAGTDLSSTYKFAYKTEIKMQSVLDEFNKITTLASGVIAIECADDVDDGDPATPMRVDVLNEQLEKSYIKDAEFTVTIYNPNNMGIDENVINGSGMLGFTAVKDTEVIEVVDGKITIVGDETDAEAGKLVYTEVSRLYENNYLTIKIKTEGKTSKKALAEALKYNLVLTCDNITAKAPNNYNSSASYKLVGDVVGNSPIYTSHAADAEPVADIDYDAVQDVSDSTWFDTDAEISETVRISTDKKPGGGGGGGGGSYRPVTPVATPTPTFAPDELVPVPDELNDDDHMAYIIGYPEGDVRPVNNISREEVATIFYRLLTDEARSAIFTQENDFSDVEYERWSNNAISTLSKGGYITGYEDGTFKPSAHITRAEFVTMAARFYNAVTSENAGFTDVDGHWAEDYINRGVYYRLIDGYEDGSFQPNKLITRSEAMKIVNSMLNRYVTVEGLTQEAIDNNWIDNPESAWYYTVVLEATTTHDFTRPEGTLNETWTEMRENPDWAALEKTWTQTGTEHIE